MAEEADTSDLTIEEEIAILEARLAAVAVSENISLPSDQSQVRTCSYVDRPDSGLLVSALMRQNCKLLDLLVTLTKDLHQVTQSGTVQLQHSVSLHNLQHQARQPQQLRSQHAKDLEKRFITAHRSLQEQLQVARCDTTAARRCDQSALEH